TWEGQVYRFDSMAQDVLETNEQRKFQATGLGLFDHVVDLNAGPVFLERSRDHVPRFVDVEVFRTPALDVIQIARVLDVPGRRGDSGFSQSHSSDERTIRRPAQIATGV